MTKTLLVFVFIYITSILHLCLQHQPSHITEPRKQTFSTHSITSKTHIRSSASTNPHLTQYKAKSQNPKMTSKSFKRSGRTQKKAAKRAHRSHNFTEPDCGDPTFKNESRNDKAEAKAEAKERAERNLKRQAATCNRCLDHDS